MSNWEQSTSWSPEGQPLAVALAAPKDCGKTAYLAALRHIATLATVPVEQGCYRLSALVGHGATPSDERDAEAQLESTYWNIKQGGKSEVTQGWHCYRGRLDQLRAGENLGRDVYLLDAKGGHLFPGALGDRELRNADLEGPAPTLAERLALLRLTEAEKVLMVFVNEPMPTDGNWRIQYDVPSALAEYIAGVRFDRVILYVASADVLFPRLGEVRTLLADYNRDHDGADGLRHYVEHFRGSPQCSFTLQLIHYLVHSGLLEDRSEAGRGSLGLFWGSAFGVERFSGQRNVRIADGTSVLRDSTDWIPLWVLEPLLWSAGLLLKGNEP